MNRASKALRRLVVIGVAAGTAAAGFAVLGTTTPAATLPVAVTPPTAPAVVGSCSGAFTVSVAPPAAVTVVLALRQTFTGTGTIGFCTPGTTPPAGITNAVTGTGLMTTTRNITTAVNPDNTATATFGVYSTAAGSMEVAAGFGGTVVRSPLTWTAPPPPPTPVVTLTPATVSAYVRTCQPFTGTLVPASASPTLMAKVQEPGTGVIGFCDPTKPLPANAPGSTEKTITTTNGTIVFGVFSTYAGSMNVAVGIPGSTTVRDISTVTWKVPVTQRVSVACDSHNATGACTYPTSVSNVGLTARVVDSTGSTVPMVAVSWAVSPLTGHAVTPATCTTGSQGACSVTLTNTNPRDGEQVAVTANIAGSSATKTVTWRNPAVALAITDVHQPSSVAGTHLTIIGRGPIGQVVSLHLLNAATAGSYVLFATVPVNANGDWSYTFHPSRTGTYHATTGTGSNLQRSNAVTVPVTVKVTIDRLVYMGRDARGMCVTRFLGGVFPYVPGAPVWVRNSAVSPTQPIGYANVFQRGGSGRYDVAFGLVCGRAYHLFALISGADRYGIRHADNGVSYNVPYLAGR